MKFEFSKFEKIQILQRLTIVDIQYLFCAPHFYTDSK